MTAMDRRNVFLPAEMWAQLQAYALRLSVKEGRQVSTSEAMRRILERSLRRHGNAG